MRIFYPFNLICSSFRFDKFSSVIDIMRNRSCPIIRTEDKLGDAFFRNLSDTSRAHKDFAVCSTSNSRREIDLRLSAWPDAKFAIHIRAQAVDF